MSFYREAGGRGVMFLLRLVCEHLLNVNKCCYGRCYGKSRILLIRFLKSRCFNAGNRVRLFQDNIPKCLKFTILLFKKKCLLQPNITPFEYKTTLTELFIFFINPSVTQLYLELWSFRLLTGCFFLLGPGRG